MDVLIFSHDELGFIFAMQPISTGSSETIGIGILKAYGQHVEDYWYWLGIGALIGFYILFNLGFTISLGYMPGEFSFASTSYHKPPQEESKFQLLMFRISPGDSPTSHDHF